MKKKDRETLQALLDEKVEWKRDLYDDCVADFYGYKAHCEKLSEGRWYCAVWREGEREMLFHSEDAGVSFGCGDKSRWFCETIMKLEVARDTAGRRQVEP